ncbi:Rho GTPase, putative [Entamoeba invadens IP1]|uniref:small monomeric GTPase n=1 Tax=Entamoeba invadens IP1 TaxID=370355 RepID=A0A0A1U9Y7_ENTIV|nr:Rho GTPase, putative [Entamoeba invadens IP1]ELP89956.1 Rho GTPase, putative [Entamoeba invadens IP1]|eukprot:XP_004256727.1 Rho GTPase, putative [Entamoeba invadens IP1]
MDFLICVIAGDHGCGKTCLLTLYSSSEFPTDYIPTCHDDYHKDETIDSQTVKVYYQGSAGSDDYDFFNKTHFSQADAVAICFAIDSKESFESVEKKWKPKIDKYNHEKIKTEAEDLAKKIGAQIYIECSAKENINVDKVFEELARVALKERPIRQQREEREKMEFEEKLRSEHPENEESDPSDNE